MEELKNICLNLKPIMLKLRDNKKLTPAENSHVVAFYLEVCDKVFN